MKTIFGLPALLVYGVVALVVLRLTQKPVEGGTSFQLFRFGSEETLEGTSRDGSIQEEAVTLEALLGEEPSAESVTDFSAFSG